ncbi:MAG: hypothetical protein AAFW70_24545 [Cyanobacteria bacterium J06635_10]
MTLAAIPDSFEYIYRDSRVLAKNNTPLSTLWCIITQAATPYNTLSPPYIDAALQRLYT